MNSIWLGAILTGAVSLFGAVEGPSFHPNISALHVPKFDPTIFVEGVGEADFTCQIKRQRSVFQACDLTVRKASCDVGSAFSTRSNTFGAEWFRKYHWFPRPVDLGVALDYSFAVEMGVVSWRLTRIFERKLNPIPPVLKLFEAGGRDKDIGALLPLIGASLVSERSVQIENLPNQHPGLQEADANKPPFAGAWAITLATYFLSIAVAGIGAWQEGYYERHRLGYGLMVLGAMGIIGWAGMIYCGWLR